MKIRIISIILLATVALFYSCERNLETLGISRTTTFAVISIEGDDPMFLGVGESYTEPGGSTSTGDPLVISGDVDVNSPGVYTVFYSAENKDGFKANVTRTVYVSNTGDFVSSIEGLYTSTVTRSGVVRPDMEYVSIWATGNPNEYILSHGLGGWYAIGSGYGNSTDSQHTVTVDFGTNTATVSDEFVYGFGPAYPVVVTDFAFDPATKTITYNGDFISGTYIMETTLTQVQF